MHLRLIQRAQSALRPLLLASAGGVSAGLCGVAQAYLVSITVDRVFLGGSDLAGVSRWLLLMLGVIAARGILVWLQDIAASEVAIRVKLEMRSKLFAHMLRLGPMYVRGQRTGELTTAGVDGIEALDAYYSQYLPQLAISALVPLAILILVFPMDPLTGAILLVTAPIIPFFMYMIGRTAEAATARQYATLGRMSSHLLDSIQGLATLKIFGQAAAQAANIARVADRFREVTLKVLQVSFLSAFALELVATLSTAIIAVEVGLRLLYGQMAFQPALFLLIVTPEFYAPLRILGARFHAGITGTAAAHRIFEILDTPVPARPEIPQTSTPAVSLQGQDDDPITISLRNVSYTYPGRDQPALDRIDLDVATGGHLAIVGASGAGKSTLAALLLGFIHPDAGEVRVAQYPAGGSGPKHGVIRLGWVPQAPHLFHASIAENIRLGKPEASVEDVLRAAYLAHLDEFIESLPAGLETMIGEGGARLSSGEAQRLSLARAFLVDAPILVLDEPTSSLDPGSEAQLDDSLQRLGAGRTVVTIAHRLNTIERADEIILLERGRIVERGTHPELLASGREYWRLLQADGARGRSPGSPAVHAPAAIPGSPRSGSDDNRVAPEPLSAAWPGHAVLRRLLDFLRGSWMSVALSILLAALTIGSSVALMGSSAWLISAAALHPSIATLQVAIVSVRLFGISRAVFRYLERLVSHGVTFRLLRSIRVWFYSHLEPLAPARLLDYHAGDLVNRAVADVETLETLYVRVLLPAMTAIVTGALVCTFLWSRDAAAIAAVCGAGFVLVGLGVPVLSMRLARGPGSRLIALRGQLRSQMVDAIQGLADLVAFGRIADRSDRLRIVGDEYALAQRSMARISSVQAGLSVVVINLAMWSTLCVWIRRVADGSASGLLLAPLALIVLASFEAVAGLPQAGQSWPATAAAARRLLDVVSIEPAVGQAPTHQPQCSSLKLCWDRSTPILKFQGVSFQYPGRSQAALREVTFALRQHECVAMVGPSGAGKSTLAQLLLRFWEFGAGEILLGGHSLQSLCADEVRAQIGYVSQHPYVFETSIFENLRLAGRGLSLADVKRAARQAALDDFIQSLPEGYGTLVGEHGATLSTGERQRLGIARIILKDAPLLILDEPTANLDALGEAHILESLFQFAAGRSCLFITHRLRRMDCFDRILVMDKGRIHEEGSHRNLMSAEGLYAHLWTLQNRQAGAPACRLASRN